MRPVPFAALWLVPLFGGRWLCRSTAGVATAMLAALAVGAFGLEPGTNDRTVTIPLQGAIVSDFRPEMIDSAISAYFTARIWGMPGAAAWTLQCAVSVAALAAGVRALRRPRPTATCCSRPTDITRRIERRSRRGAASRCIGRPPTWA